ncbi:MAG: hypothetical protein IT566_06215 [Rhodospirillaceae bacterium]|nr:hypothetical protein [Rhodospirillaceae bacterium]
MKLRLLAFAMVVGSAAFAAEPKPFSGPVHVDPKKPVDICGLHAPSLDQVATALVEKGGVREAAGDEKFLAYEQLDFTHIWTFTRLGHAAYPAVICRELKDGAEGLEVKMEFLCGGARAACTTLYNDFQLLNAQMKASAKKP